MNLNKARCGHTETLNIAIEKMKVTIVVCA